MSLSFFCWEQEPYTKSGGGDFVLVMPGNDTRSGRRRESILIQNNIISRRVYTNEEIIHASEQCLCERLKNNSSELFVLRHGRATGRAR